MNVDVDTIVYGCRVVGIMLLLMPITNEILIKALLSKKTDNKGGYKKIREYLILEFLGVVFLVLSNLGLHINDGMISARSYIIIGSVSFFTALIHIGLIVAITMNVAVTNGLVYRKNNKKD